MAAWSLLSIWRRFYSRKARLEHRRPTTPGERRRSHESLLGPIFALFLAPAIFVANPVGTVMSDAILGSAVAIVDHGSLELRPDSAADLARIGGHYYSGLPPGASLLAVPAYAILSPLIAQIPDRFEVPQLMPGMAYQPPRRISKAVYYLQLALVPLLTAPLAAVFLVLFFRLLRHWEVEPRVALGVTLAAQFGSFVLPYSGVYSRQLLALVCLWGPVLWVLRRGGNAGRLTVCGFGFGMAVAIDYSAALPAAILAGFLALRRDSLQSAGALALGGAPVLLALAGFHQWLLGDWLATPYHFRVWSDIEFLYQGEVMRPAEALMGPPFEHSFGFPNPETALRLLVGPFKGLFSLCPLLALGFVGHVERLGSKRRDALSGAALAILGALLLYNATIRHEFSWSSTPSHFGPRYLLLAVPGLLLGLREFSTGAARLRVLAAVAAVSAYLCVLAAMFHPNMIAQANFDHVMLQNPWRGLSELLMRQGPRVPWLFPYAVSPGVHVGLLAIFAAVYGIGLRRIFSRLADGDSRDRDVAERLMLDRGTNVSAGG